MLNRFYKFIIALILVAFTIYFDRTYGMGYFLDGKTFYGIYVNNEFYGKVENIAPFENYILDEYDRLNEISEYGEVFMPVNYEITEISSAVDTVLTEEEILDKFKENVDFLVNGYKVEIFRDINNELENHLDEPGNETEIVEQTTTKYDVIYAPNKEEVDIAFNRIVSTFIDQTDLDLINAGIVPEFEVGTEVTIEYSIGGTIFGSESLVPYDKIYAGDELYQYMLFSDLTTSKTYIVQEGDTIEDVAFNNGLNVVELVAANPDLMSDSTILAVGQELNVNLVKPVITVESTKVRVVSETIPFETIVEEDDTKLKTDADTIKQEGKTGSVQRTYEIEFINGQITSTGQVIDESNKVEPTAKIIVKGTAEPPTSSGTPGSSYVPSYAPVNGGAYNQVSSGTATENTVVNWHRVAGGGYLSSGFGPRAGGFHNGIDIAGPVGTPTYAAADGVVTFAGWGGAGGNMVVIDHQNGYVTHYYHHSSLNVVTGQSVVGGQQIGGIGNTGNSFGAHLHFSVFRNGQVVNPVDIYGGFY